MLFAVSSQRARKFSAKPYMASSSVASLQPNVRSTNVRASPSGDSIPSALPPRSFVAVIAFAGMGCMTMPGLKPVVELTAATSSEKMDRMRASRASEGV